jgi:YVTN family beta-propeller protein
MTRPRLRNWMKFVRLASALLLGACTAGEAEVSPPRFAFYYPTGLALSKDAEQAFLFVASANADLRFSAGTVQTLDLAAVDAIAAGWAGGSAAATCAPSISTPRTLLCPMDDEDNAPAFVVENGGAQTGNFSVDVGVQLLDDGKQRLFSTVRGDPSITYMDFDPSARVMDCGNESAFQRCAESHRLDVIRKDEDEGALFPEPFYVLVDNAREHVFVSHLTSGFVTLVSAPLDGTVPYIADLQGGFFQGTVSNSFGATGMAADANGIVYVASRSEGRIARVRAAVGSEIVDDDGVGDELLVRVPDFLFIDGLNPGDANEVRSIAFSGDGRSLYVMNRSSPQLLVYDVTPTPTGAPSHQLLRRVEICGQAASLAVARMAPDQPERVYIPCFSTGQVWVIDPLRGTLDAIIESGRGPNAAVASPSHGKVYVTNYAEDTISVIDTEPGSATENFVVLKLGVPRGAVLQSAALSPKGVK